MCTSAIQDIACVGILLAESLALSMVFVICYFCVDGGYLGYSRCGARFVDSVT